MGVNPGCIMGRCGHAAPVNGRLLDRNVACSFSLNRLRRNSRCWRSTLEDASCCHLHFAQPGSCSLMFGQCGPRWGSNLPPPQNSVPKTHTLCLLPTNHNCPGHNGVAGTMANESAQLAQKAINWCELHFGGPTLPYTIAKTQHLWPTRRTDLVQSLKCCTDNSRDRHCDQLRTEQSTQDGLHATCGWLVRPELRSVHRGVAGGPSVCWRTCVMVICSF